MLSSTAGAAEVWGSRLGEFVEEEEEEEHGGRPYFKQRDTVSKEPQYLYFEDPCWQVSLVLGNGGKYIRNCQDSQLPPTRNWEVADGWNQWSDNDTSLTLEFTPLSPCKLVRVAGEGDVVKLQGDSLGDYRSVQVHQTELIELSPNRLEEGRWSTGRPVFKKVDGEPRFLQVEKGEDAWTITTLLIAGQRKISSGRATNSPVSPEAGPRVKEGVSRWRYWDGVWKEGDISVTCL